MLMPGEEDHLCDRHCEPIVLEEQAHRDAPWWQVRAWCCVQKLVDIWWKEDLHKRGTGVGRHEGLDHDGKVRGRAEHCTTVVREPEPELGFTTFGDGRCRAEQRRVDVGENWPKHADVDGERLPNG